MIELLYITLILFGGFLPFFLIFPKFKYLKIFILSILFVICCLISYKFQVHCYFNTNNLCKRKKLENIQRLDNDPINLLNATTFYPNGTVKNIDCEFMNDKNFSLIRTENYSIQCLENYYIRDNLSCPITDIKLSNKNISEYQHFIKINDNEYLHFTKENKLGKLYKSFNYNDFKNNIEDTIPIDKIIRKEFHKLSNPYHSFNKFTYFFDSFNESFIIITLLVTIFFENSDNLKCNVMKIINTFIFQSIFSALTLIRFIRFIEYKKFLFENKDIYYDESNFPKEIFNLDIFPLGICINIFLYNILYIIFPNKISFCKSKKPIDNNNDEDDNNLENKRKIETKNLFLFLIISIIPFIFPILNLLTISNKNEINLKNNYNHTISNWKMAPLKSIQLKNRISNDENLKQQSEDYFEIERIKDYNYINTFLNRGKKCGKDNDGNYLFFPEGIDCPINGLFISNSSQVNSNYTQIELIKNRYYLYYTNQNTEGKILIDIWNKINSDKWKEADLAFSIPFKELINSFYSKDLYSIYYIGINISSIEKNAYNRIENFEGIIDIYKYFRLVLLIIFCVECLINLIGIILMFCLTIKLIYFILFLLVNISFIILLILYLNIDIKYIIEFLDKINSDFEFEKSEIRFDIIILLIVSFVSLIIIIILMGFSCSKKEDLENNESRVNLIHDLDKEGITPKEFQNSEVDENKDNNDINFIKKDEDENNNINNEIIKINGENKGDINIIKDNDIENINNEKIIKIKDIDANNKENENLIIENNKTFDNLNLDLDDSNRNSFHIFNDKKENDSLKNNLPFELKEDEKLMCVIFQNSEEKEVQYPIKCKDKLLFKNLEDILYDKYPKYKETENEFYVDDKKIDKLKTLEENNIKDGQVIMMKIMN